MSADRSNRQGRHILVVGGAGYVGSTLTRYLLAQGDRVRVLDALIYGNGSALAGLIDEPGFSFVRGDIRSRRDIDAALEGITDVVLLAALVGDPVCKQNPQLARAVNLEGGRQVLEASGARAGIDRFVFASTCSNYGLRESDDPADETAELKPLSLYAETKVEMERQIVESTGELDLAPVVLRVATAFGQSQRMRFDLTVSEFTRDLALGRELEVYDADTWRPYCHVADISRAIRTVLCAPRDDVAGQVFNVGGEQGNYTKRGIVETVQAELGNGAGVRWAEGGVDPRNYRVSFDKIRDRIGFEARFSVPDAVRSLAAAIRGGVFDDVEARPGYYANHALRADAGGEGSEGDDAG